MELKDYQRRSLGDVERYLRALDRWKDKSREVAQKVGAEYAPDFTQKAWEEAAGKPYRSGKNGLGEFLPSFCLKIPTGGGKTLLAVKAIDLIGAVYRKRQTGLVLWVVPTTQIYRQTLQGLRRRDHPYRQHLDAASAGRTLVLEKTDRFTPVDVAENLVVLLLMLPSASRQNKETLKVFQDSGGFAAFFPPEDRPSEHEALLRRFPNLDYFGKQGDLLGRQIKTSLGNALRVMSPVIVVDEGHRAYSETAQETLRGFNPSLVVELSATPAEDSNVLVDIKGVDVAREQMIKLDLHVVNKTTADWRLTMLAARQKRDALEKEARRWEASSGRYIRPICLVQAERTGKDQRGGKFIHAEDVKEYLLKSGVPAEEIAVKSSETDDIEGIDLLARGCPIRYIITKQALQEGWDCSFAYVLAVLTNPGSKNGLTQLVGRILRQPEARKTGLTALDESYVYCYQQKAETLLENIRKGFSGEGLGDLQGHIVPEDGAKEASPEREARVRPRFKIFADRTYLPVFVIKDRGWRKVVYESDVLSRVDWAQANFGILDDLVLRDQPIADSDLALGLSADEREVIAARGVQRILSDGASADPVFAARQLTDVIPNPWTAFSIADRAMTKLVARFGAQVVGANFVHVIGELRAQAERERDRLAEKAFRTMIDSGQIRFLMLKDGFRLPSKITLKRGEHLLNREDGSPLQLSLFEATPDGDMNPDEKAVAWYLDEQRQLLWWYRNMARQHYSIQGWRKNRIYPDFVVCDGGEAKQPKVYVVETKGVHLKNEDTAYKQDVFALCTRLAKERSWSELGFELPANQVRFEVVFENEWRSRLDSMLAAT